MLEERTVTERDELSIGMRFVVRPGETFATDGLVVRGREDRSTSLDGPSARNRSTQR